MLPSMITLVLALPQQPPAAFQQFQLRPAVVLETELEFTESMDVESDPERKPLVMERPLPARTVATKVTKGPKAVKKAKAPLSAKRNGRP